jgi:hypothetical protein
MKKLILTTALLFAAHAQAAIHVGNTRDWKVTEVAAGSPEAKLFADAELLLSHASTKDSVGMTVVVHSEPLKVEAPTKNAEAWRKLVLAKVANQHFVLNERAFKKDGQWRYIVEYQTDTGSETMLSSIVLATAIKGELHLFSYENHPKTYQAQIGAVRSLFRDISISGK